MAENINNTSLNDENSVSSFDYKAFLLMMLLRWPIILGCVLVALIGSFFYIKTLTPQYTVSSTILIKDESKSKSGKSGIDLQELGLITSSAQNFDNELGILQTHTLVKKVVCNLNLYIHYSSPGTFRSEELYKDNAVNVWVTPEDAEKIKHADVRMKLTDKKVLVDIKEIKRPDRDAQLVAENIAQQLENRVSFRRAMKSTMGRSMKAGVKGIKTAVGGRLGGADIARTEFYSEGTIPLQTLRADIDYGFAEADTTYGKLGVKVWIYKGEVLPTRGNKEGSDK